MEFNFINLVGGVIVAVMLIPNILYGVRFPGIQNRCTSKLVNLIEQIGRYASMALMVLPLGVWEFGFASVTEMLVYAFGNGLLLLAYLVLWVPYFRKRSIGLGIWLAVIPTGIFLLSGLLLRHWLLASAAVVFGIGHIFVTYRNHT